ncbi:MAG: gliding motility-associated C-terminal domain-containing protein, partial [Bacteroidota bacterium]
GLIKITEMGGAKPYFYQWSTGQSGHEISQMENLEKGEYFVTISDHFKCSDSIIEVEIKEPGPVIIEEKVTPPYCEDSYDGSIKLNFEDASYSMVSIEWKGYNNGTYRSYPSDSELTDLPEGTYWYIVTDDSGCVWNKEIELRGILNNCLGDINNVITPNGDGLNDIWTINDFWHKQAPGIYPNAVIYIYDRRGRQVYYNNDAFNTEWNGTDLSGSKLPADSYHFIIDLKNGTNPITGIISIVY